MTGVFIKKFINAAKNRGNGADLSFSKLILARGESITDKVLNY